MTTDARYRLLAKWASGGMADVYVARQQGVAGFDKIVALKFLREPGDNTTFREMFLEEVRTTALLNHPSIVQTFDAGEHEARLFMAMEFVNGETLGRFARVVKRAGGSFPVELAVAIVRDVANALDYAHTLTSLTGEPMHLVHRDVSPSNILLSFDGMVKLLDFGIAKVASKATTTRSGVIKGKFSYMSPEQVRGQRVDHRADIYSLGIVLWQLLTGRPAHEADSEAELLWLVAQPKIHPPSKVGARCTEVLDDIVMGALAPKPEDRYANAGDFATSLSRYLARYASGFDSNKLVRALMAANFNERRTRLSELVKRSDDTTTVEEHVTNHSVAVPMTIAPPRMALFKQRPVWLVAVAVLLVAASAGVLAGLRNAEHANATRAIAHEAEPTPDAAVVEPIFEELPLPPRAEPRTASESD